MFKKVIIVEDLDVIGNGILNELKQIKEIEEIVFSQYCDEAFLKILDAKTKNEAFDLLITDLSFNEDYRSNKLSSGSDLITKLKEIGHTIPTIVFTVEDRPSQIKNLINNQGVSAYVLKDRNGLQELNKAIKKVAEGESYLSQKLVDTANGTKNVTVDSFDIRLLSLLASGKSQVEISTYLSQKAIKPNSLSTIEKHLNDLKDVFKANNVTQLVAYAKDLGLI